MKKSIKIASMTAAVVMILSCGVAFADEADNQDREARREQRTEKRQEALLKWEESLSEEDQAKFDIYQGKVDEMKELRVTLHEKHQVNRELEKEVKQLVKSYTGEESKDLTDEQLQAIQSFNDELRNHVKDVKTTASSRKEIAKHGKVAMEERNLDGMISYADEGIVKLNDMLVKADDTTVMLQQLIDTLG